MCRTVKTLFKKATDPYLALLAYRATPLANGICHLNYLWQDRFNLLCRNYLKFYTQERFLGRRYKQKKQSVKETKKEDSTSKMPLNFKQWFLTWVRSNPRGSVSQSQGSGGGQDTHPTHMIRDDTPRLAIIDCR